MKNITVFAGLVIIALYTLPAAAQESYALSLAPQFGLFYGQTEEIVYPSGTKYKYLSQLLWDVKPVFYYGMMVDFSRRQPLERVGFFSTLSLKYGIPGTSGTLEDRDWMSTEHSELTHFSSHTNHTNELIWLDVMAGVSVPIRSRFLFRAYVSVPYMRFYFTGTDGYKIYSIESPPRSGNYPPVDLSAERTSLKGEKAINYTQEWLTVTPGVSFGGRVSRLSFDVAVQISPFIFCADRDEHLMTDYEFRDYMRGGLFLEPQATVSLEFTTRLSLSLDYSWRYISGSRGETYQKASGDDFFRQRGTAGTGMSMMDTGLRFRIRL